MAATRSPVKQAIEKANRAQAELDRRLFHLKALHDTACELSVLTQPRRIMETFLLTAMGLFGVSRGITAMVNVHTGAVFCVQRGLDQSEAQACEQHLCRVAQHHLTEDNLPRYPEIVQPGRPCGQGLFPSDTAVLLKQKVDGGYALLSALGPRYHRLPFADADAATLINLAATMGNVLAQNLFHREVQHLSAGLMRQASQIEDAQAQAGTARATLDRQVFHLQTLYDFTAELSPVVATDQLVETFLLTVMGTFGAAQGCVLLCNRQQRVVRFAGRGIPGSRDWSSEAAEKLLYSGFQAAESGRLAPMSAVFIRDPHSVFPPPALGFEVHSAVLFTVDETLLGIVALGELLKRETVLATEARELLLALTVNWMAFLKNARAFETIQALNADLSRTNDDLRRTIDDLTEAHHRIRILEIAKNRLKQLIQREVERAGRLRAADVILMAIIAVALALGFNHYNPHGITLAPGTVSADRAERIDVPSAHQLLSDSQAVMVDARPPELFQQRHIAGAINIPATLFDVIFPMKLAPILQPDRAVLVYGRTISKHYDDEVAQRVLQRHERVMVMEGGLEAWEKKGLAVSP